jgi:hypothetical protein
VQEAGAVDLLERFTHLLNVGDRLAFWDRSALFNKLGQIPTRQEFHNHIGGVVLLKGSVYLDDVTVTELGEDMRLVQKTCLVPLEICDSLSRARRDCTVLARATFRETLLDRNWPTQACIATEVSDTKAALTKDFSYGKRPTLKFRAWHQGVRGCVRCCRCQGRAACGAGSGSFGVQGTAHWAEQG